MSDASWGQLCRALRFLGLVDGEYAPSPVLKQLAEANDRRRLLGRLLRKCYPELFKLDLSHARLVQIDRVFQTYGISSTTLVRARSFFISVARYVGIELSPALLKVSRHRTTKRRISRTQPHMRSRSGRRSNITSQNPVATFTANLSFDLARLDRNERQRLYSLLDQLVSISRDEQQFVVTQTPNANRAKTVAEESDEEQVH